MKKMHLEKRAVLALIIVLLITMISSMFLCQQISTRINQYSFYSNVQNIVETNGIINKDSFYKVDDLCSFHIKSHSEFEKCNCAIMANKLMFQKNNSKLNNNEVSISKNISNRYHLKIGDKLFLLSPIFKYPMEYMIKEITNECYGLKDIDYLNPSGLILFGNNEKINEISTNCITFMSDLEIKNLDNINPNIYRIKNYKKAIVGTIIVSLFSYFIVLIILMVIYLFYSFHGFIAIAKNKKKYGEDLNVISKESIIATLHLLTIPIIILLANLVLSIFFNGNWTIATLLILFVISLLSTFISEFIFVIKTRRS